MLAINNCAWLPWRMHIEERRTREKTDADSMQQAEQREKHVTPDQRKAIWHRQTKTPGGIQVRAPCGLSTIMASETARARLHWAIISVVLPVTFGHAYCMPYFSLVFLCTDPFRHKSLRLLFRRLALFLSCWAEVAH